jgi:hypothetical protein
MIAELTNNAPFNLAKAKMFADRYPTVGYRSVIAKVKSLGLEYEKAEPAAKKDPAVAGPTKAQILSDIRLKVGLPDREGDLTKAELLTILGTL